MFKIVVAASFLAAVSFNVLNEDGELEQHSFKARYKYLSAKEFDALIARMNSPEHTQDDTLQEVWVGWDAALCDEHGQPLPHTQDNRERVTNILGMRAALIQGFFRAVGSAAAKNLEPAPASSTSGAGQASA